MACDVEHIGADLFAGLLGEVLPVGSHVADPTTVLAVHGELLGELAHPEQGGDWVETWRRIGALAHEGGADAWLGAVTAASEALRFVTELAVSSSFGLFHLADLVGLAWPQLSTLGEPGAVPPRGPVPA